MRRPSRLLRENSHLAARLAVGYCAALGLILAASALAGDQASAKEASGEVGQTLSLPFAFFNEKFGFAGAYVYGRTGYPQPQSSLIATVMAGSEGSAMGFVAGQNMRLPGPGHMGLNRLFVDPVASIGYFSEFDAYVDGDPSFTGARAGSNDSDKDNHVTGDGWDNFFRLKFKYLLPIGHGRKRIVPRYVVSKGMLVSGGEGGTSLNLLESGRTFIEVRPFYRAQGVDGDEIDDDLKTNGLDIGLFVDNRNFPLNPSAGGALRLKASRDFGQLDSSGSWTVLQAEFDTYISLGATQRFRQRVLAFDFWTAYSPTWEVTSSGKINNRPPAFTGATLGGLWRMRAFPAQRFSDKTAIYYTAELRLIPKWNPFNRWPGIQKHIGVEWLQFVPFVEIGRVAPKWNFEKLHADMKWDVGLGVRVWAKGFVVRLDSAFSKEDAGVQMMISHPLQF